MVTTLLLAFNLIISTPTPEALSQNHDFWIAQLQNNSPDIRMNALDKLGELRNPSSIPKLSESLQDPDARVRFHAIQALSKFVLPEALTALQARVPKGGAPLESDPYLAAEVRRAVKSIEDVQKANEAQAEKKKK